MILSSGVATITTANDDIGGFQVAMHNALLVGGLQPVGKLARDVQSVSQLQNPLGNSIFQALPLDVSHHEKRMAFDFIDFMNRADIRMVNQSRSPGFPEQPSAPLAVPEQTSGKKLQCHPAPDTVSSAR